MLIADRKDPGSVSSNTRVATVASLRFRIPHNILRGYSSVPPFNVQWPVGRATCALNSQARHDKRRRTLPAGASGLSFDSISCTPASETQSVKS